MSFGWETTEEDVLNCLEQMGKKNLTPEEVSDIHNELDFDAVEHAAMTVDEFDEQVACAYHEIKNQISKMGI